MKHLLCAGMNKRGVPALVPFLFFLWWGDWTWLGGMALTHHDAGRWSQLPMSPAGSLAALGAGGPGRGTPAESRAVHREEDAWGAHCVLFSLRQGQVDEAGQRPHPQSPAHRPREGMGGGEVALALPASGFHAERLHTDSILSLYRLALRDGQGLAQGHTANG